MTDASSCAAAVDHDDTIMKKEEIKQHQHLLLLIYAGTEAEVCVKPGVVPWAPASPP